jgi:hypothetical protein
MCRYRVHGQLVGAQTRATPGTYSSNGEPIASTTHLRGVLAAQPTCRLRQRPTDIAVRFASLEISHAGCHRITVACEVAGVSSPLSLRRRRLRASP